MVPAELGAQHVGPPTVGLRVLTEDPHGLLGLARAVGPPVEGLGPLAADGCGHQHRRQDPDAVLLPEGVVAGALAAVGRQRGRPAQRHFGCLAPPGQ